MEQVLLPLQLAPQFLNQPILPNWQFSFFRINVGSSNNSRAETEILQKVGSYGKQIGHLAEALEVVIGQLKLLEANDVKAGDKQVLEEFLADVAKARAIKNEVSG